MRKLCLVIYQKKKLLKQKTFGPSGMTVQNTPTNVATVEEIATRWRESPAKRGGRLYSKGRFGPMYVLSSDDKERELPRDQNGVQTQVPKTK